MVKIIQGTFAKGNGVIAWDTNTDKIYHLIVIEEQDGKPFIEINEQRYYLNGGIQEC